MIRILQLGKHMGNRTVRYSDKSPRIYHFILNDWRLIPFLPLGCIQSSTKAGGVEYITEINETVKHNKAKNPNLPEANLLAILKHAWSRIWTRDSREQIQ